MAKIAFLYAVIGHWLACVWFYIGGAVPTPGAVSRTGEPVPGWVERELGQNPDRILAAQKGVYYVTSLCCAGRARGVARSVDLAYAFATG